MVYVSINAAIYSIPLYRAFRKMEGMFDAVDQFPHGQEFYTES